MTLLFSSLLGLLLAGFVALAQQPSKVDDAAILNHTKTGEEWLTYNLGWSEQRYSQLNQINSSNVNSLTLAWIYRTGVGGIKATPLEINGVLYDMPVAIAKVLASDIRAGIKRAEGK